VGFLDFIVAVGTGLAATLRRDPRMGTIATFPFALIPLFGVGFPAQRISSRSIFCVKKKRNVNSGCTSCSKFAQLAKL
jgi:hypothetical protein